MIRITYDDKNGNQQELCLDSERIKFTTCNNIAFEILCGVSTILIDTDDRLNKTVFVKEGDCPNTCLELGIKAKENSLTTTKDNLNHLFEAQRRFGE